MPIALLYDNSTSSSKKLTAFLEDLTFSVDSASSLSSFKQKVRDTSFSLIVMDAWIRGENRSDLVNHIRKYNDCPIIFVSEKRVFNWLHEALRLQVADFFIKPIQREDFLNRVSLICNLPTDEEDAYDTIFSPPGFPKKLPVTSPKIPDSSKTQGPLPTLEKQQDKASKIIPPMLPTDHSLFDPRLYLQSPKPNAPGRTMDSTQIPLNFPSVDELGPKNSADIPLLKLDSFEPDPSPEQIYEPPDQSDELKILAEQLLPFHNRCLRVMLELAKEQLLLEEEISQSKPGVKEKGLFLLVSPDVDLFDKINRAISPFSLTLQHVFTGGEALDALSNQEITIFFISRFLPDIDSNLIANSLSDQFPEMQVVITDKLGTASGIAEVIVHGGPPMLVTLPLQSSLTQLVEKLITRRETIKRDQKTISAFTRKHKELFKEFSEIKLQLTQLL